MSFKRKIAFVTFFIIVFVLILKYITSEPVQNNAQTLTPTSTQAEPLMSRGEPVAPTITNLDTRDPNFQDNFDEFFSDYCKTHDCSSPSPKPNFTKTPVKVADNEKTFCLVEKNGTFEMTVKECQELHDSNPKDFQIKAYTNCVDGKNPNIGDDGSQESRKQECSDLMGIVEN